MEMERAVANQNECVCLATKQKAIMKSVTWLARGNFAALDTHRCMLSF